MEILLGFAFLVAVFVVVAKSIAKQPSAPRRTPAVTPNAGTPVQQDDEPAALERYPVKTKPYFFSRSENAFFGTLCEALTDSPYTVFPNVRLNDIFVIEAHGSERMSVLGRLRDKHVDFLVVARENYRPVCGIELDGTSHLSEKQQKRDAVKNVVFRSAGFPLVRLDARPTYTPQLLRETLGEYLPEFKPVAAVVPTPQLGRP